MCFIFFWQRLNIRLNENTFIEALGGDIELNGEPLGDISQGWADPRSGQFS